MNDDKKDLVKVIRCKNCKHYSDNLNDISGVCHYEIMARIRAPEDYCSKGKWKDDPSHPFADDVMMGE